MTFDRRLDLDPHAEAVLTPVSEVVRRGLDRLPPGPPLVVRMGDVPGFSRLDGATLLLSSHLEGPEVHHPDESPGPMPPLDRWRRAAGCVLEAVAVLALGRQVRMLPGHDWRWIGAAIHAADLVAPELGVAAPDLALAIRSANPGRHPRAGVAVMRAWSAKGHDPVAQVRSLLTGGVVSTAEWVQLGRWVLASEGLAGSLPVPVARPDEIGLDVALDPWCWAPIRLEPHPRGGRIELAGGGEVAEPWVIADTDHRTLAGTTAEGGTLIGGPGGPVGSWTVASAQGFGQVMGARGVSFTFERSGVVRIVLADAFVGPLAAVAMADHVGTSGVSEGRWRVAGPHRLAFADIATQSLTMHGRRRDRFMMPAGGFGMGEWLGALVESPWAWEQRADRLVLRGEMMGGGVEVRLRRDT